MGLLGRIKDLFSDGKPQQYSASAYHSYAKKLQDRGQVREAVVYYEAIINHKQGLYDTYYELAQCYRLLKDWQKLTNLGRLFDERLSYYHEDLGKNCILEGQEELAKLRAKNQIKQKVVKPTVDDDAMERGFIVAPSKKGDAKIVTLIEEQQPTAPAQPKSDKQVVKKAEDK